MKNFIIALLGIYSAAATYGLFKCLQESREEKEWVEFIRKLP